MSATTYTEYELKIVRVMTRAENWENDGFVATEHFEIRDGDEVLLHIENLEDLLKNRK